MLPIDYRALHQKPALELKTLAIVLVHKTNLRSLVSRSLPKSFSERRRKALRTHRAFKRQNLVKPSISGSCPRFALLLKFHRSLLIWFCTLMRYPLVCGWYFSLAKSFFCPFILLNTSVCFFRRFSGFYFFVFVFFASFLLRLPCFPVDLLCNLVFFRKNFCGILCFCRFGGRWFSFVAC